MLLRWKVITLKLITDVVPVSPGQVVLSGKLLAPCCAELNQKFMFILVVGKLG